MNVERVTKEIPLQLIRPGIELIPVRGLFSYRPDDPYSVNVVFRVGAEAEVVEWVFGRDLVSTGLTRETGLGDVRIWPSEEPGVNSIFFSLSSPEGSALLECPAVPLQVFLEATFNVVPYGAEEDHLDMDSTIQALLGDTL